MIDNIPIDINSCHSVMAGKYVRRLTRQNIYMSHSALFLPDIASSEKENPEKARVINNKNENRKSVIIL